MPRPKKSAKSSPHRKASESTPKTDTPRLHTAGGKNEQKFEEPMESKKKRVRHSYLFAVGRRKTSIARTRLYKNGKGEIIINEKDYKQYFPQAEFQQIVIQPLEATGKLKELNLSLKIAGGGTHSQAEACRHGISRALIVLDKDLRRTLKPLGFLRRDPREKERKKPGLKRARRAPQFSKR